MRRNHSHSIILSGLAVVTTLFTGCGFDGGDRTLEEVVEQNYQVNPTATLRITNGDGSIRIYAAKTIEIKLQAIKKAYSARRLAKIAVNVSARPNFVSIETFFPPRKTWGLGDRSGTVDYILVVPQTCRISKAELANGEMLIEGTRGEVVDASLISGRLFARNCFGNAHLRVARGGVDVAYDWWEQTKFSISAEIENGGARAFIPGDASFHLVAETEEGQIANDFTEKEQRQAGSVRKIDMLIGPTPEADVKLHARDGNIQIRETNR